MRGAPHVEFSATMRKIRFCSSPAHSMARQPCPIKLESGSVPSDHRLRLNKHKRLFPSRPEPAHEHPKESVMRSESRPRTPALQYDKLLPQSQILQEQVATRTEQPTNKSQKGPEQSYHTSVFHAGRSARHMMHVRDSSADRDFGEATQKMTSFRNERVREPQPSSTTRPHNRVGGNGTVVAFLRIPDL